MRTDPLEAMRFLRPTIRESLPDRLAYDWHRRAAMRKVRLPIDDPLYYQAVRDADHARSLFRMFGLLNR